MIDLLGITKTYTTGAQSLQVLKGVDLAVETGELVAIMGSSGSGKSTLLSILTSCAREGAMLSGITLNGACQVQLESAGADDVVEVHQRPYCPLSAEPITWLARGGLEGAYRAERR